MSSGGSKPAGEESRKKLGETPGTIFRRQGLAEASERVLDAPRTLKGMNACRNPKSRPLDFPRTRHLNNEAPKARHSASFTGGLRLSFALSPRRRREKKRSAARPRGAPAAEDNIWRLARFGAAASARGPARRS